MKNACTILFGVILTVCRTFYGTFNMAVAGTAAACSMEICADGVAKTVLIGAKGTPVEPAQNCAECLTCCNATGAMSSKFNTASRFIVLLDLEANSPSVQDQVSKVQNILRVPHGLPHLGLAMLSLLDLMGPNQMKTGNKKRSDWRLHFKDAYA